MIHKLAAGLAAVSLPLCASAFQSEKICVEQEEEDKEAEAERMKRMGKRWWGSRGRKEEKGENEDGEEKEEEQEEDKMKKENHLCFMRTDDFKVQYQLDCS